MAKRKYFIPRKKLDFVVWHDNLNTQLPSVAMTLGLPASDPTTTSTDNGRLHAKATVVEQAKTALDTAQADFDTVFGAVLKNSQSVAGRANASANMTPAIKQQLRLVGAEITTDPATAKPVLRLRIIEGGSVEIGFVKNGFSGVKIFSKRAAETAWTFLTIDTESPYIDNRPNLGPAAEQRQYQAIFMDGDDETGLLSDIATIGVLASVTTTPGGP